MSQLKIAETILRERKKKNMTQEELATALSVSPQAVSNWERGGYPDITLLPRIANFFEITVDELIGNDEVNRSADIEELLRKTNCATPQERLSLAREYYEKYPADFSVCEALAMAIKLNKDCWDSEYPLLKRVCEHILSGCTWEWTRQNAVECMSIVCPDEEWENWKYKSEQFYSSAIEERIEERLWQRGDQEGYARQSVANLLLILMHFLGRESMRYYERDNTLLFAEPQRTAALMRYRMRALETLNPDGTVPEAWSGCYAELCLKAAGAMIGAGELDGGFAHLERAMELYRVWAAIPDGALMEVGDSTLFGGARINKLTPNHEVHIHFEDGSTVWSPYLWLFWQLPEDVERAMSGWPWFDGVRGTERFEALYERARGMIRRDAQ